MSLSGDLDREIQNGRNGRSGFIPFPYEKLSDYLEISKGTMYVIGAETGVGKSTFSVDAFVVHTIQWYLNNKPKDMKLSIIGFFMERKMYSLTARIVSRLIFQDTGLMITPKKIIGRKKEDNLTDKEYSLIQQYYSVLDEWEKDDLFIWFEGSKNPSGISMFLEMFAEKHGTLHKKNLKEDRTLENVLQSTSYTPNHPNHIVLVIGDNAGILSPEGDGKQKTLVDKFSRTMREAKDIYGFSPILIQQLNRGMSDVQRQKLGELEPKLSDFADSAQTSKDAEVVLAIFDPFKHSVTRENRAGYDLKRLKDKWHRTYYREIYILKNSYDSADIACPVALHPIFGIFKTLPKAIDMTDEIYESVINGKFFRGDTSINKEADEMQLKAFKGFL